MYKSVTNYFYGKSEKKELPIDSTQELKVENSSLNAQLRIKENELNTLNTNIIEKEQTIEAYAKELKILKQQLTDAQSQQASEKTHLIIDPEQKAQNQRLTMKIVELNHTIDELNSRTKKLDKELGTEKSKVASLRIQINTYINELKKLSTDKNEVTASMQQKIDKMAAKIKTLEQKNKVLTTSSVEAKSALEVSRINNQRLRMELEQYQYEHANNYQDLDSVNTGCLAWLHDTLFSKEPVDDPEMPLMVLDGPMAMPKTLKLS